QRAAQLEASKVFAKELLLKYGIPTAPPLLPGEEFFYFTDTIQVRDYFLKNNYRYEEMFPAVVKVDGLAAGKGVEVCSNPAELNVFLGGINVDERLSKAADKILLEKCLNGEEASYIVMMDESYNIKALASSQDHKRAWDGDEGTNTGGMGAYSPAPVVTKEVEEKIWDRILLPLKEALKKEGIVYKGFLYLGLMIDKNGDPSVLEINVRLGDPEAQPLLMRQESDLLAHIQAAIKDELDKEEIKYRSEPATCVIMASQGYPGSYEKGFPITGIENAENYNTKVFHSGTGSNEQGELVTKGGRVLGPTSLGVDFLNSQRNAYAAVGKTKCENLVCRSDIGDKAIDPALLAK
ncbi:MAG TPA: phosphoribosylamine--glycine ligase, partial [Patescibacteria group bacterium]|nr:phosphoribosylamine--glycine ligase [Patescibacteria group bacterium]